MLKLQLPRPAGKQPAAAQPQPERPQVPLLETDPAKGLTAEQAAQRMAAGLDNRAAASPTRSETEIIRDNIFTFFNLVFIVLALCLALVGSFANMTFLGVVIANTIIGTVQQLRSKRTVDQLTLVAAHKVRCLRDGKGILLPSEELVRDDIVEFTSGEQICADAVVCTGSAQANEALITGEAEPVPKNVGDVLRSGSFLVSGRCTVRLTHVGAESYASKLATEAREGGHKVAKGEMMRSLDGLIRVIGIALIPMGVVMFLKQYVSLELPLRDSVEATVAALIGMIPEGLYLLTSVALAVSMVRLAQRKVLAQDMNCIETLARVDVLCVDKTGTITEARMEAGEPLLLTPDAWPQDRVYTVLHSIYAGTEPDNDTARAMVQRFGKQNGTPWPRQSVVPFNSAYKWSAATFAEGSFVVGAPEFVAGARYAELAAQVEPLLEKGSRVLLLARCDAEPDPKVGLDADKLEFVALLPVANRIRPEAPETFRYFAEQGVAVKVISGDNPVAVSEVARQAGIEGAERYVDAATLDTDEKVAEAVRTCTVFGRVTPAQKRKFVKALQADGHTVAMTGDGVNDAPALKAADIGCAMGKNGTEVAKNAADMVLTDDNFATIVSAVREGRTVYGNIRKTIHFLMSCNIGEILVVLVSFLLRTPTPLLPAQLLWVNLVTDSLPALALGSDPPQGDVMRRPPTARDSSAFSNGLGFAMAAEGMMIGALALLAFTVGRVFFDADPMQPAVGRTMAFAVLSLSQLVHSYNMRSTGPVLGRGMFKNRGLNVSFLICSAWMAGVVVFPQAAALFGSVPLTLTQWGIVAILALLPLPICEMQKRILSRTAKVKNMTSGVKKRVIFNK